MRSLTHRTLSGFLWQSSVAGANVVIRALVLIILARHLPARDFGIVAAAMVVATVTQVFAQIGVTQALVQRLHLTDQHVRSGFAVASYTGLIAGLGLFVCAPAVAGIFRIPEVEPVVRFFSVLLPLNGLAAVPIALLQRAGRFRESSGIELVAFAIGYGAVGITLTLTGLGVWALAIAQVTQVFTRTIMYVAIARPKVGLWPRRHAMVDLLHVGTGFSAGQIGNLVATQVDNFVVGRLLGAEALGLYSRAYQLLMLPAQLLGTAAQTVLFPSIAAIQDQPERVARALLRSIGVIAMITIPLSGVVILLAPELVVLTIGPRWLEMVAPFQILIASLMFRTSYKISDSVALAIGSMYERAWRQWIYAAAVAVGAWVGARWSLAGVSAGVALAVMLNFLLMLQLAMKLSRLSAGQVIWIHARHAVASIPIVGAVGATAAVARGTGLSNLATLGSGSFVAAAVSLLMWWRFRWIFGADGEWVHSLAASRFSKAKQG